MPKRHAPDVAQSSSSGSGAKNEPPQKKLSWAARQRARIQQTEALALEKALSAPALGPEDIQANAVRAFTGEAIESNPRTSWWLDTLIEEFKNFKKDPGERRQNPLATRYWATTVMLGAPIGPRPLGPKGKPGARGQGLV